MQTEDQRSLKTTENKNDDIRQSIDFLIVAIAQLTIWLQLSSS